MLTSKIFKIFSSGTLSLIFIFSLFISFASYKSDYSYLGYTFVIYTTAISALVMAIGLFFTYKIYIKYGTIDIAKVYEKYKGINKC